MSKRADDGSDRVTAATRLAAQAAAATLVGILLSGPVAVIVVARLQPQPPWQGAETFVGHYHALQMLPYLAGFLLVGGYAVLLASLRSLSSGAQRPLADVALVFTAMFAALVFFNYIVQTTFVPALVRHYAPENAPIIAAFSMSNPTSLPWAIEIWAYGLLGVATWLIAPIFSGSRLERATSGLFVANGVVSVASALLMLLDPTWAMTPAGFVAFMIWNALVFVMSALALLSLRQRLRRQSVSPDTQLSRAR